MHARHVPLVVLLAMPIAGALPFACSSTPLPPSANECTAAPIPPSPADAAVATSAARSAFAMTKLYLGGADRMTGVRSQTAWKGYGLNIDGKVSTRDSAEVCRLASGASRSTQADGCSGIDNSFGANVLPIILTSVAEDAEAQFNASIANGLLTNLITVDGLEPARDTTGLRASLRLAGARAHEGASWAQTSDSFLGGDASAPRLAFENGFVSQHVFVAGPSSGDGQITIGILDHGRRQPVIFTFTITHVQVVATVSEGGTTLSNGIISGILPVVSFVETARRIGGAISATLCHGSAFESIAQQLRQAADILVDGTQDPTRACDGISFGIGFEAKLTTLGPVVDPLVTFDGCADGGAAEAASDSSDAGTD